MRLRTAVPAAALGGAVAAAGVLLLMPAASPPPAAEQPPASSAVAPQEGGQVEEPDPKGMPVGAVTPGYGSARSGPAGVPLGFAHSAEGAAAAATAWLSTVEGSGVLDGQRRSAVLAAIGDAGFVSAVSARLADRSVALGLDASGRPAAGSYVVAMVWASRGAYRVVSYGGDVARVEVWHLYQLGVVAPGAQPGPGLWRRATVALRWDGGAGDWRVTEDFRFVEGPDPKVANPSRLERTEVLARLGGAGWRLYADTRD